MMDYNGNGKTLSYKVDVAAVEVEAAMGGQENAAPLQMGLPVFGRYAQGGTGQPYAQRRRRDDHEYRFVLTFLL